MQVAAPSSRKLHNIPLLLATAALSNYMRCPSRGRLRARQGSIRRGGGLKEGGGGRGVWLAPPPRVPLSSAPKAGRKFSNLNPLGAKGAEAKFWLSAPNVGGGRGGGGGCKGGHPPSSSGVQPFYYIAAQGCTSLSTRSYVGLSHTEPVMNAAEVYVNTPNCVKWQMPTSNFCATRSMLTYGGLQVSAA